MLHIWIGYAGSHSGFHRAPFFERKLAPTAGAVMPWRERLNFAIDAEHASLQKGPSDGGTPAIEQAICQW